MRGIKLLLAGAGIVLVLGSLLIPAPLGTWMAVAGIIFEVPWLVHRN